jgi:hypothetical protein
VPNVHSVRYRLVVEGELGPRYSTAFEGMELHAQEGSTEIVGVIKDQAHLRGMLDRIASLGLNLVSAAPDDDQGDSPG